MKTDRCKFLYLIHVGSACANADKYHFGYWLSFYLYLDLRHLGEMRKDKEFIKLCDQAYFGKGWSQLL